MILFENHQLELYNSFINNIIKIEKEENSDLGDTIERIMPKYLRREQFNKCVKALNDIYNWSKDTINHDLDIFHKNVLYHLLKNINTMCQNNKNLKNKYFNKEIKSLINKELKKDKNAEKNLYNISWYIYNLYSDDSYIDIINLFKNNENIEYLFQNNEELIREYYDIMPNVLKEKYKLENINIFEEIENLLLFIKQNIKNNNLAFMFWEETEPMKESKIQIVLENIMDAYFHNQDIDISRETSVGSGNIDFKFYKNKKEKILFEIKKASNTHLKAGYEKQLIEYMKSCRCKNAYYIIICYTKEEIQKVKSFIKTFEKIDEYHDYIKIELIDVTLEEKKFNPINITKKKKSINDYTDGYFSHIETILKLSDSQKILDYLRKLKNNYHKIKSDELKKEYINRIRELHNKNRNLEYCFLKLYENAKFYHVYDYNLAPQKLVLDILGNIEISKDVDEVINVIIPFFKSINEDEPKINISEQEINDIFKYLKEKHSKFYQILKSHYLEIYLFDFCNDKYFTNIIPKNDFKKFSLINYSLIKDQKIINPIIEFFRNLGYTMLFIALKDKDILDECLNEELLDSFANIFSTYLMHDSKYQKYDPHGDINSKEYNEIKETCNKLIDKLISKEETL